MTNIFGKLLIWRSIQRGHIFANTVGLVCKPDLTLLLKLIWPSLFWSIRDLCLLAQIYAKTWWEGGGGGGRGHNVSPVWQIGLKYLVGENTIISHLPFLSSIAIFSSQAELYYLVMNYKLILINNNWYSESHTNINITIVEYVIFFLFPFSIFI